MDRAQSVASVGAVMWTEVDAPAASGAGPKDSVAPVMLQPALAGSMTQARPAGKLSVAATLNAVPAPSLVMVIVNPTGSPADTLAASAVLVMPTFGQSMTMLAVLLWPSAASSALAFDGASLEADTVAVLARMPQSSAVVSPVTRTVALVPAARVAKVQVRTPASMLQWVVSSTVQPIPTGRVSLMTTFLAVPGPALLATMLKAADSPAEIDGSTAVFTIETIGQSTTIVALLVSSPVAAAGSLAALTAAVLWICPAVGRIRGAGQVDRVGGPDARSPKLQVRTPATIVQLASSTLQAIPVGRMSVSVRRSRARAAVADDDREARGVAGGDRAVRRGLADVHIRALDHDRRGRLDDPKLPARAGGRVGDGAAVGGRRLAGDMDGALARAGPEGARRCSQVLGADRAGDGAAGEGRAERPVEAAARRQVVDGRSRRWPMPVPVFEIAMSKPIEPPA